MGVCHKNQFFPNLINIRILRHCDPFISYVTLFERSTAIYYTCIYTTDVNTKRLLDDIDDCAIMMMASKQTAHRAENATSFPHCTVKRCAPQGRIAGLAALSLQQHSAEHNMCSVYIYQHVRCFAYLICSHKNILTQCVQMDNAHLRYFIICARALSSSSVPMRVRPMDSSHLYRVECGMEFILLVSFLSCAKCM